MTTIESETRIDSKTSRHVEPNENPTYRPKRNLIEEMLRKANSTFRTTPIGNGNGINIQETPYSRQGSFNSLSLVNSSFDSDDDGIDSDISSGSISKNPKNPMNANKDVSAIYNNSNDPISTTSNEIVSETQINKTNHENKEVSSSPDIFTYSSKLNDKNNTSMFESTGQYRDKNMLSRSESLNNSSFSTSDTQNGKNQTGKNPSNILEQSDSLIQTPINSRTNSKVKVSSTSNSPKNYLQGEMKSSPPIGSSTPDSLEKNRKTKSFDKKSLRILPNISNRSISPPSPSPTPTPTSARQKSGHRISNRFTSNSSKRSLAIPPPRKTPTITPSKIDIEDTKSGAQLDIDNVQLKPDLPEPETTPPRWKQTTHTFNKSLRRMSLKSGNTSTLENWNQIKDLPTTSFSVGESSKIKELNQKIYGFQIQWKLMESILREALEEIGENDSELKDNFVSRLSNIKTTIGGSTMKSPSSDFENISKDEINKLKSSLTMEKNKVDNLVCELDKLSDTIRYQCVIIDDTKATNGITNDLIDIIVDLLFTWNSESVLDNNINNLLSGDQNDRLQWIKLSIASKRDDYLLLLGDLKELGDRVIDLETSYITEKQNDQIQIRSENQNHLKYNESVNYDEGYDSTSTYSSNEDETEQLESLQHELENLRLMRTDESSKLKEVIDLLDKEKQRAYKLFKEQEKLQQSLIEKEKKENNLNDEIKSLKLRLKDLQLENELILKDNSNDKGINHIDFEIKKLKDQHSEIEKQYIVDIKKLKVKLENEENIRNDLEKQVKDIEKMKDIQTELSDLKTLLADSQQVVEELKRFGSDRAEKVDILTEKLEFVRQQKNSVEGELLHTTKALQQERNKVQEFEEYFAQINDNNPGNLNNIDMMMIEEDLQRSLTQQQQLFAENNNLRVSLDQRNLTIRSLEGKIDQLSRRTVSGSLSLDMDQTNRLHIQQKSIVNLFEDFASKLDRFVDPEEMNFVKSNIKLLDSLDVNASDSERYQLSSSTFQFISSKIDAYIDMHENN